MNIDLSYTQSALWHILTRNPESHLVQEAGQWTLYWVEAGFITSKPIATKDVGELRKFLISPKKRGKNILQFHFRTSDPLERKIELALIEAGIRFHTENEPENETNLDFFLPDLDICIEIKGGHTPRVAEQMSRHHNVIVIQGVKSTQFLVDLLKTVP